MIYAFDDCELDTRLFVVRRAGRLIRLRPKVFQVLTYLLAHRDRVVLKQELLEQVWPEQFVSIATLENCVKAARQAVGDSGRAQRIIQTIHGHGYRFVAAVAVRSEAGVGSAAVAALALPTSPPERPLTHQAETVSTPRGPLEGERKHVTVLSCALANAMALTARWGHEGVQILLHAFFERALREVQRYGGRITQFLDDSFLALFGAPTAHEDHARRAVLAAMALQRRLETGMAELGPLYGAALAVRMGLHTGPVVIGNLGGDLGMDYTAGGDTTNLAVRLQTLAAPGTILVSAHTYRLTQGYFTFRPLGQRQIIDGSPDQVFHVTGQHGGRSRIDLAAEQGLTPFIGRQHERAFLEASLAKIKDGAGQIVSVVSEPGMGKSRLLLEFRRRLQGEHITYLEGRCLSYGQSMLYLPFVDILKKYFAVTDASDQTLTERVIRGVEQVGLEAAAIAPCLVALLSGQIENDGAPELSPEARRKQTFAALHALFLTLSHRRPLILVVEDLHWIDQLSEAFLTMLSESLGNVPLMLLVTYRSGYRHTWGEKSYYSQLALHPLSEAESGALIAAALGVSEISADLQGLITRRAEGNPFYLEEITRSFLERGIIQHDGARFRLRRTITPSDMPETIRDVIVSRIDRLPEEQKRVLQTAAVIGREFAVRLLQRLVEHPERLDDCLSALQHREFLYEKRVFPNLEYMFKHVLTQEAAYHSLLSPRRKGFHAAIGLAMEALDQERLAEHYEALAYHFSQGESWEKAFLYLHKAGDKARQAYANQEALAFYTQAIEVSGRITPAPDAAKLLPVYEGRGLVWLLQTKYDEAIADFRTMLHLARTAGDRHKEGESLCHLAYTHWLQFSEAQMPFVEQYAQQAMQLAQQTGDQKILARSLASLGAVHEVRGNLQEAQRAFAASLELSRREGYKDSLAYTLMNLSALDYWQGNFAHAIHVGQEGLVVSREVYDGFHELYTLAFLCLAHGSLGNYGQAFARLHEGMTRAKERDNTFILGRLMNTLGWLHREFHDLPRAIEYDRVSAELERDHRLSNVEISALINLGLDYLVLGQPARALTYLEPTLDRVQREAFGAHRWRWKVRLLLGLAESHYATGAYTQALRCVEEGLNEAQATSSQKYVAKGWALRGKIAAQLGDAEAAGVELRRAFALAEQLRSPALSYPLAYDLGQWCETVGREGEAAALYNTAKTIMEQMATAVEDDTLRAIFRRSVLVQAISERAACLSV